jgi:hypothetical protein
MFTVIGLQQSEVAKFTPQEFLKWLYVQDLKTNIKWNNTKDDNKLLYAALRKYSKMQATKLDRQRYRDIAQGRFDVNQQKVFGNPQGMSTEAYGQYTTTMTPSAPAA